MGDGSPLSADDNSSPGHALMPLRVVFPSSAGKMLRAAPRSSTADFSVKLVTRAYYGLMFRS